MGMVAAEKRRPPSAGPSRWRSQQPAGRRQTDRSNVNDLRPDVAKAVAAPRREILVEEQLHFPPTATGRRPRSAANARQARMSLRARSGKPARVFRHRRHHRPEREGAPRYGRTGIPETWLVDVEARTVTVYTVPGPDPPQLAAGIVRYRRADR